MGLPLEGVRVLDLSRAAAGPFCTMLLGDMGADVIKVERPGTGDECRQFGPPFIGGESPYFLLLNRNKRGLTLDLKAPRGKEIVRRLVSLSDVLVENFRPGTMDRLGLGYEDLRGVNPRLIYCSISGFGSSGPAASLPGYDLIAQGMGGIMSLTGEPDGPPLRSGIAQADLTAGMFAAYGIMAALLYRKSSGLGQRLETSLFESQIAQLTHPGQIYLITGEVPGRCGNLHPLWAPFEVIQAKDGHHVIAVTSDDQWSALCGALGLEDCSGDPRFASNEGRLTHRRILRARIEERTRRMDREEIKTLLDGAGVPNGPVWDVKEVLHAPQTHACRMVEEMTHPLLGRIFLTGIPVKLDQAPGRLRRPPPLLGQHTEEILSELLSLSPEEIQRLKEDGVV